MKFLWVLIIMLSLFSCTTSSDTISRNLLEDKMGLQGESNDIQESKDIADYSNVERLIEAGENESHLYYKYKLYKDALREAKDVDYPTGDITEIIKELELLIDVTVDFESNIGTDLTEFIEMEVDRNGLLVSDIGFLTLEVKLIADSVVLKNDYYNKIWTLSVSLIDSRDQLIDSEIYSARESQITEENLDSMIVLEARKELNTLIKKILK